MKYSLVSAWLLSLLLLSQAAGAEEVSGESILFWTPQQQITGYRAIDKLFSTRPVTASTRPYPLLPDPRDFSGFSYRYDGRKLGLEDYIRE
ncbi:MAG: hypothetical protein KDI31_18355, partial [Pseudomonadales bacterium]|nr:hypothetical protein [Pseudomonadales bacterium]